MKNLLLLAAALLLVGCDRGPGPARTRPPVRNDAAPNIADNARFKGGFKGVFPSGRP